MAAGAVAQKLSLYPKAAGNAGEQHKHFVVPPGTSPESLGSWIHLVVVGKKKKAVVHTREEQEFVPRWGCSLHSNVKQGPGGTNSSYPPFTAGLLSSVR